MSIDYFIFNVLPIMLVIIRILLFIYEIYFS